MAEWEYVVDVPDITFRVTQDVDLDGDEETIYGEGFFDVRWNAGTIPPVTLQASPIARPSPICDGPVIPCGNKPAIVTVGLMPLAASHHDNGSGCATRPNRPRPGGLFSSVPVGPAQAPYAGTLQLHGCHHLAGAQYYRLLYSYEGNPEQPFLGLEWYPPKLTGPPWWFHAVPDGAGWYQVLPEAQLVFPHWLLNWPTWNGSFPNGNYAVRLQLADASKNPLAAPADVSDPVTLTGRQPRAAGDLQPGALAGEGRWLGADVHLAVRVHRHPPPGRAGDRDRGQLVGVGRALPQRLRGSGRLRRRQPALVGSIASREHWHENFGDNFMTRSTLWSLPGSLPQGSYSFSVHA